MEHFVFAKYRFTLTCATQIRLPAYSGSTLRGGFGHAFRRVACAFKGKDCLECLLRDQCVYAYVFETPVPEDAAMMRKYTHAPHPFVLSPPVSEKKDHQPGESLNFDLTLIGRAVDFLPYFIYAFQELGQMGIGQNRGKYTLESVRELSAGPDDPPDNGIIYTDQSKQLDKTSPPISWSQLVSRNGGPPSPLTLHFQTPVRIKYQNQLTKNPEFHVLFRNLLRRTSLLSYFHCKNKIDDTSFKDLIEQAKTITTVKKAVYWHDWQRFSGRQQTKMNLGGFLGEITYQGELEPFWPYLKLGEIVHAGKGSSFGLGRYEIKKDA